MATFTGGHLFELQSRRKGYDAWDKVTATFVVNATRGEFHSLTEGLDAYYKATAHQPWNEYEFRLIGRDNFIHEATSRGLPYGNGRIEITHTLNNMSSNVDATMPVAQPKESTMQLSSKLTVKKATLEAKIQAKLDEAREAWETQARERSEKNARRLENYMMLFSANPEAVLIQIDNGYWDEHECETINAVTEMLDKLDRNELTIELAVAQVKAWVGYGEGGKHTPDPQATKLLSVLQAAEDKTLEVTTDDDLYKYL